MQCACSYLEVYMECVPMLKNKVLVQRDSYGYLWCLIVDFATSAKLVANIWVILLVCDQVICEEPLVCDLVVGKVV